MQKKILFLMGIAAQFITTGLFAWQKPQELYDNNKSLLWEISGNGLKKSSFLFGTIHAICREDYFFSEKMHRAFAKSEKLVMEINLSDPSSLMQYQESMILPKGKQLKDYFSSENEYDQFSKKLKSKTDIDISLFQQFKPLVLLSLIAQKGFQCSTTSSYEMNLLEMSKEKNLPVEGLETSISQMKIFDDMSDDEIKKILVEGIEDIDNENSMQSEMVHQYKNENIDSLHRLIVSSGEFRQYENVLIDKRNEDWCEKLPAFIQTQSCFIAVGAGHLSGPKGVIALLRKKGYQVVPVFDY